MFWRRTPSAEDIDNPKATYLLVYETPDGPAIMGQYRGRADDAMDAAQECYVNLMWESGELEQGRPMFGNYGIIPENDLSPRQRAQLDDITKR